MNKVKHVRTLSNNKGWIHWFETSTAYHFSKHPRIQYSGVFLYLEQSADNTRLVRYPILLRNDCLVIHPS